MIKEFEDYLEEQFLRQEPQFLDDDISDAFGAWLECVDRQEYIDYANKFLKEELKKKDEELKKNIGQLRQYLNERTEKKPIASTELEIFLLH